MPGYFIPTSAEVLDNGVRWYPEEIKLRLQHYAERDFGGFFELGMYHFGGNILTNDVWLLVEREFPDGGLHCLN